MVPGHRTVHAMCLQPSSSASVGNQQEKGLQVIMAPQTQQYPERKYFTAWLEGSCASGYSDY